MGEWTDLCTPSDRWLYQSALTWRRIYPGRADQVTHARRFVRSMLAGTGRCEDAEFIVSELASNAILHTLSGARRGWFGVEVSLAMHAWISVRDLGGRRTPSAVVPAGSVNGLRENGRGLPAVAELALATGYNGDPVGGHTVWAQLGLPPEPPLEVP
ncbi:ATP-binding protein [Actinomadura craniellae]|uniref:ATP-binding protein n=1 Tax=Actinomadura craniellae TaxID=2231787 RepID=A0A365H1F0_9ACTN|nr:ATP-binding protein [Actinomadura craniellae]RAY12907.1 ATP-binding protein [Actinomadura craniellae]